MPDYYAILSSLVYSHGLLGLFAIAFLSASLLPFPSEPVIILATKYFDPLVIILVVTIASTLAAFINYYVGFKGLRHFLVKRDKQSENKAEKWFKKWGAPVLIASPWIPFIGDLFPVAAGTLKMDWKKFLAYIIIARVVKTAAVILIAMQVFSALGV